MRMHEYGDASVLRLDDVEVPVAGDGQVLVRVAGTSFNPSEIGLRNGWLRGVVEVGLPYTLGWDLAGTVVGAGGGFADGDRVVGRVSGGAAAEFVVAEASGLVRAPGNVPLAHAAALPIAGVTAWQAVFEHARIADGATVFVNGAGGGIGGYVVQLARYAGAHVTATASERSADTVRALGAHVVHGYLQGAPGRQGADGRDLATHGAHVVHDYLQGAPGADGRGLGAHRADPAAGGTFDVVFNLVPLEEPGDLVPLVKACGVIVSVTNQVVVPDGAGIRAVHFVVRDDAGDLAALVRLVEEGVVRLDIAAERSIAEMAAVHRAAEAGQLRGKTILKPPTTTWEP
ncbi:NADP-dependent oxidoreductase [Dactylosporangium darangshiense]|uniref:NADP-dependent oxidoreductase n=1 Tax=Dactylosporangium darangshiense TaxID=579108 RepID=A0ABP8D842_9ACTN